MSQSPVDVTLAFVERINAQDVCGLCELMTHDHRFIDPTGAVHVGRERMREAWQQYFAWFPNYRIAIDTTLASKNRVAFFGVTFGTYAPSGQVVEMHAAVLATVRDGKVAEWRVCADNEPTRAATRD